MKRIQGPRGREYPEHNPKSVALLGMGPSVQDYMMDTMTQELKPGFADEIWSINMTGNCFRSDLIFWMDDLVEQSKLTPHWILPTANLKEAFSRDDVQPLLLVAGERFGKLLDKIHGFSEYAPAPEYEWCVEEFKSILNGGLGGLAYGSVTKILTRVEQDKKGAKQDESRSLKGLIEVLASHNTPVISAQRRPEVVPNSFDYPLDEVAAVGVETFGKPYLNNGVAMAVGYAIWKGVKKLRIYGCDFTYPNRNFAETGRGCVEAWITLAVTKYNVEVILSPNTSLLDSAGDIGIYGFAQQPEIHLPNGTVIKYQGTPQSNGQYYRPEVVGKHGAVNELSSQSQADSSTGPQPRGGGGRSGVAGSSTPNRNSLHTPAPADGGHHPSL